jgi:HK97 family phage prohead protease
MKSEVQKFVSEVRTLIDAAEGLQLRVDAAKPNTLVGYAAVFGSLSADLGGFKERILPAAFKNSLSNGQDVRALVDHDPGKILGRTSNGTLRLSEDNIGLRVEIDTPDTTYGRDVLESVRRGDIRGMSFGFKVPQGGQRFLNESGLKVRELTNIDLREVTATSIPAYGDTSLLLRVDPDAIRQAAEEISAHGIANCRKKLLYHLASI